MPALWLDASDAPTIETVPHWQDRSGSNRHATAFGSPTLVAGALNGMPVMRYSGTDGEYHGFSNMTNIRTVFWLWKHTVGYYFMLGDDNRYHFHRDSNMFNN